MLSAVFRCAHATLGTLSRILTSLGVKRGGVKKPKRGGVKKLKRRDLWTRVKKPKRVLWPTTIFERQTYSCPPGFRVVEKWELRTDKYKSLMAALTPHHASLALRDDGGDRTVKVYSQIIPSAI